jgi:hypothetical protein
MSFSNGPTIVTNGLVLALDAGDRNSYVSGSSTWFDLSGNNYNFTLDPGMTWNSAGYFNLASNIGATYSGVITNSTTCTIVFWIRSTELQSLFWAGNDGSYYVGAYRIGNKEYWNNAGNPEFFMDAVDTPNIYDYFPNGQWHMVEFKSVNLSTWTLQRFNKYTGYMFTDGALGSISVYNRNLTPQESLQNYNNQKSKFGL